MRPFLLAASLALAAVASAQTVLLRYRPPVGTKVAYTMRMAMTMTTDKKMPGMAGPMKIGQTTPVTMRVLSRTADTTTVETRTGPAKFDPGSPMGAAAQGAKPQVVRMTMDQYGTPRGGSGGGPAAAMMSSMGQSMQGVVFPKKPLKVGDTWTQTIDMGKAMSGAKTMGPMKMQGKIPIVYRLVAVRNGVATIAMTSKGTLTMAMGAQPINAGLNIRSTVQIDTATGLAKGMTMVNDTTTQIPGMGAMRQHMTMSMK